MSKKKTKSKIVTEEPIFNHSLPHPDRMGQLHQYVLLYFDDEGDFKTNFQVGDETTLEAFYILGLASLSQSLVHRTDNPKLNMIGREIEKLLSISND